MLLHALHTSHALQTLHTSSYIARHGVALQCVARQCFTVSFIVVYSFTTQRCMHACMHAFSDDRLAGRQAGRRGQPYMTYATYIILCHCVVFPVTNPTDPCMISKPSTQQSKRTGPQTAHQQQRGCLESRRGMSKSQNCGF